MRHSAAHVMAEAVLDLFPGTKLGIGPAIADGFYYDFDLPRPLTTDDLAAIEAAHERVDRGGSPVRPPASCRPTRAGRSSRSAASPTRSRSSTTSSRRPQRRRDSRRPRRPSTSTGHSSTCAADRTSSRPGKIGPFKLLAVVGRLLARRPEAADAAAHLRHGRGRRRRSSIDFLWRREEAKKRDHRQLGRSARPLHFHDVSPGAAFWHPKGWTLYQHAARRHARPPGAARLPGDLHAAAGQQEAVGAVGPLGPLPRATCSWSRPRSRPSASSR